MVEKVEVNNIKQKLGAAGEKIARSYLAKKNYIILDLNYRFHKLGEIDIIAQEKDMICFIEVKTRKSLNFGLPSEAVGFRKQGRIKKLAYVYLNEHKIMDVNFRFDIIEILYKNENTYSLNHIENAF